MKRTNLIYGLIISVIVIGCSKSNSSESNLSKDIKAKKVTTITVEKPDKNTILNYSGLIIPTVEVPLSFQLPGSVASIFVDEGDYVKKGQVLAELNKTSYESTYAAAQAAQRQAQDAYDRLKIVYDKGSLPDIKWEDIKSKLEQANSSAVIAKQNLDNCTIVAVSDGIVGSRNIEVGATVVPMNTVLKLIQIDDVFVRISVPENEINKIKKDQPADVEIPAIGDQVYQGKVEKIGVMANLVSKTYTVKLRVKNNALSIKPGMVCDVNLSFTSEEPYLRIPIQALMKDVNDDKYIYLIDKQNKAKKTLVEVGEILQNEVIIRKGIKVGDQVVVKGQNMINDQDNVILN